MEIEWSVFALKDRHAIFDYIEADSLLAGVAVDERIEQQVEGLEHESWSFSRHPTLRITG